MLYVIDTSLTIYISFPRLVPMPSRADDLECG